MNKKVILPVLAVTLSALLLICTLLYDRFSDADRLGQMATLPHYTGTQQDTTQDPTGDSTGPTLSDAPNVQFYDAEGKAVQLSDLRGKPLVINFWATWSGPSKGEIPVFQAAYEAHKDEIHFVMINMTDGTRETKKSAQDYWDTLETEMPFYFDTDSSAAIGFNVNTVPTTFFVDAQGKAVAYAPGGLTRDTVERGIRMCLATNEA